MSYQRSYSIYVELRWQLVSLSVLVEDGRFLELLDGLVLVGTIDQAFAGVWVNKVVLVINLAGEEVEEGSLAWLVEEDTVFSLLLLLSSLFLLVHFVVGIEETEGHEDESDKEVDNLEGNVSLDLNLFWSQDFTSNNFLMNYFNWGGGLWSSIGNLDELGLGGNDWLGGDDWLGGHNCDWGNLLVTSNRGPLLEVLDVEVNVENLGFFTKFTNIGDLGWISQIFLNRSELVRDCKSGKVILLLAGELAFDLAEHLLLEAS